MRKINVALIGLGTVGNGVYETIHKHEKRLQQITNSHIRISTIVIQDRNKHKKLNKNYTISTNIEDILVNKDIDVVFEAIVGKEPAFTYVKQCIKAGKHVITANKEMFAAHGSELKELAKQYEVEIGFDATTAGGIPVIQTIQQLLKVNKITKVQAILNGTTNYILTEMREKQLTFPVALKQAQQLGYAEADPKNDVEGFDAFYKLMILTELIFDKQPVWEDVNRMGIEQITTKEINKLAEKRMKHVATVKQTENGLHATVEPITVSKEHPLYAVEGVDNGIHLQTDILGELTLIGPGAGALPTASAMVEDFCTIFKKENNKEKKQPAFV